MNVFITGAAGFIGGTIANRLLAAGHRVSGLVRNTEKADALAALGIAPIAGTLDDHDLLVREARAADAVINAANSDHRLAVEAMIEGLAGSGKPFLHTSGSSIVGDEAAGEPTDAVYDEDHLPVPRPDKAARVAIDDHIRAAAGQGVRSAVLCNTLIYGHGRGLSRDSVQLPTLLARARRTGVMRHVGRGLNIWSNVHIDDVADAYLLALEKAAPGAFYFIENGEASYRDMTAAIARVLNLGDPQPWPIDEAIAELGVGKAVYSLGSNSRVRGLRARPLLGWTPRQPAVLDWIANGMLG
ncbi:MAG: NAD-dependent epimerase/dehydratase family protein [Betaproteobacteria bacterium]